MHPSPVYPCELELPPASQYYIRGLSVVLVLVFVFVFVFVCFVCVCTSLRPLCIQSLFTPASSPLHLKRQNASQASREHAAAALKAKNLQIYPLQDANMFVRASRGANIYGVDQLRFQRVTRLASKRASALKFIFSFAQVKREV